jgi:hypothetical protein
MTTAPNNQLLLRKLAALRRKQTVVSAGSGLSATVTGLLLLLSAQMVADWWFDLPWSARLLLALVDLAVAGLILALEVVRPIRSPLSNDEAALLVEHATPELRSRLISAVQLPATAEAQRAPAIVARLVTETETATATLHFPRVVSARGLAIQLLLALAVAALAGFAYHAAQPISTDLLKRVFLSTVPVPRKTRVECVTRDRVIARGENIHIEAIAHGVVPPDGKLTVHTGGRSQTFPMTPVEGQRGRFTRRLENVLETFTYRVRLNDGTSDSFRVTVEPQPTIASLKCAQVYPSYTGLAPQPRALGDLTLLAGSTLQLEGIATKPLRQAAVRFAGLGTEAPLTLNDRNPRMLTGQFAIPNGGLTGFSLPLLDERGLHSRDEVVYRIDVLPDKAPTISILYPTRKEELVTANGTLLVSFEASDDFGIAGVAIHYKLGEGTPEQTIELDLEGRAPKTLRRRHEWKLAALQPPLVEGAVVEYWIAARDNNNVTGPGVTATDHYYAKIVSETEKRTDLMNRLDDYLTTLNTVADSQEKLNQSLGELIRARPGGR